MAIPDIHMEQSIAEQYLEDIYSLPNGERVKICIQCGTCSGVCPNELWLNYTPHKIIHAIRMKEFDEVLADETLWMCVSCYACENLCPQEIPLTSGLMTRLKEEQLLAGTIPKEMTEALQNSHRYGNPMGDSQRKRADWAAGLNIPIMKNTRYPIDVLWFVGDYGAYHPTVQQTTIAFAKILISLGVDFGILGPEEVSDGDSQRMAGEYGLFEMLAMKNIEAIQKYQVNEIITTDPHAFNALKNEYPKLGLEIPVRHYTEFLCDYVDTLVKKFKAEIPAQVAFHDPCYLGRVNGIYEEPRELIKAIPGVQLVELAHHHENSLCCGGGGGGMWLDGFQWDQAGERMSEWRVGEIIPAQPIRDFISAIGTQAPKSHKRHSDNGHRPEQRILAVACPYEKPRYQDALKVMEIEDKVSVMDISELILQSMAIE